jgi:phosphoserine aminotransferase
MTEIKIPQDLLPVDGRFGCGPSKLRPEQIEAFQNSGFDLLGTSHRQAPIKNLVKELQAGLLDLFHNPAGYEILLGNGGSTAFWDVAAHSLVEGRTQALVHGEFGSKFAKALAAPFLVKPDLVEAQVGSRAELISDSSVLNYVYPQNETSTGVQTPVTRVSSNPEALFFTDATSAAGGIDFDPKQTDVYYFAPQKNFSSDGGLWIALVSPAAISRAEKIAGSNRYIPEFLSFMTALENSRLNQTLNTPAIATIFLMNEQVMWLNQNGGLAWADQRTKAMSGYLYNWMADRSYVTPFVKDPMHQSQVVVTMDFDETIDAANLAKILRSNGIVDTEPYRKLGRNQLRIATFVSTELGDVEKLCSAIDYVVERM